MPLQQFGRQTARRFRTAVLLLQASVLGGFTIMPFLVQHALAANTYIQLTERSASVLSANPGSTTDITFSFKYPSASAGTDVAKAVLLEFCDTPLGTCTTVNTPVLTSASYAGAGSQTGWDDTTTFTYALGDGSDVFNDGASTSNLVQLTRAGATTPETTFATAHTVKITGIVNNAAANQAYYVRIYSGDNATVPAVFDQSYIDDDLWYAGTVAQSTSTTLIVNARVQEHLDFCVGRTPTDDNTAPASTSGAATNSDCTDVSGDTVDIGTITPQGVAVSPVPVTPDGGNEFNGVAMVASNAANGTVISFFAEQESTGGGGIGYGSLKIPGATCSTSIVTGTGPTTDKCFNLRHTSDDTIETAMAAGTEQFGMIVGDVNTQYVGGVYAGANLVPDADFYEGSACTGGNGGSTAGFGSSTCSAFSWNDTSTAERLATSAGSAIKVINYEALLLKFAATAAVTTPTGQYTVASTYIATSTY